MGLLEAAASALPTVATSVGGSAEIVVHGHTGFLAESGNVTALAAAMNHLMQTPLRERNAMGERAQQLVTERYDLERVMERWEALYGTLLGKNPKPLRWARAH